MAGQSALSFAGLLRQLRAEARLTQEELAEAAGVSPRSVSDLERGVNRTARRDTAVLLASALGLAGQAAELFVAAARGKAPAADVLAAARGATLPEQGAAADSPYRGLNVFQQQHAGSFFGREVATTEVVNRMAGLLSGVGLLVVSGASGAGKSSLLRAGVLPRIRAAGLVGAPGAAWWPCLVFTPTRVPLDELALQVAGLAGADAAAVRRELEAHPEGFALTARQAAMARPRGPAEAVGTGRDQRRRRRLLLVVDQFEELFTQCDQEGQRRAFITALHAAATTGHGPGHAPAALVVLGVRADFEARCADYAQLARVVQDRYLVTAMTERQLRLAITEPAKKAGSMVDDDLVGVLLSEVRNGRPGTTGAWALPLLSHALDQAWRHRAGDTVTLADYERTGGIEGAVAGSAQRAYDALTPAQKATARQVFTRLTATSSEGIDSADRATRADLTAGKTPAEAHDVDQVLEAFAAERLLTLAAGTVELSHEILLTAWPLLRDTWLADTHADRIVRTRLHHTATEWDHHARDPSYLYTGTLLQTATSTADRITADPARHPPLSHTERDFLRVSDRAHHRRARRRQAMIAGLLALTVAAIAAAGIAVHNAASAAHEHVIALSRQLAAESLSIDSTEPVAARRLAVAAWRVFPTSQAGSAMTALLAEQQQNGVLLAREGGVNAVAFSPHGKLLAGAEGAGSVQVWDAATGRPVRVLRLSTSASWGVNAVAFSPVGKLLASGVADGTVRLVDPVTGHPVRVLRGSPLREGLGVSGVAFSPNGKMLASADADLTVRLWDPATGQMIRVLHIPPAGFSPSVNGVAFSPNGKLLAAADGDGTVRLWNPATGQPIRVLHVVSSANGVIGVAFSPDGKLLACADGDGTVRLWNPATGQPIRVLNAAGSPNAVLAVAFSPDGKLLASAGGDGTVRLWNPATGQALGVLLHIPATALTPSSGGLRGVAFSPDGKLLASADGDGTVRLLDPVTGQPVGASLPTASAGHSSGVNGVAYSSDGRVLAAAGDDGATRLWDLATGRPVHVLLAIPTGSQNAVEAVAYSPDSTQLATANDNGTAQVWDPATGRMIHLLHISTPGDNVWGVAFSPDGRQLASAVGGGPVRLWDPATGLLIRTLRVNSRNNGSWEVAFSPRGGLLASAGTNGTVSLWDPATGRLVRVLRAPKMPNGVFAVAFSPGGTLLAAAGSDGIVRLWDPATGRLVRVLHVASRSDGVSGVAFSPGGKLLASVSGGTVRLWDPATGRPLGVPFGLINAASGVDRVAFSPNGRLLASADSVGTVRFWDVSAFVDPYVALCADAGTPTRQQWKQYAPGEPQPSVCS